MTPDEVAYAGGVEPINGPDDVHLEMTTEQVKTRCARYSSGRRVDGQALSKRCGNSTARLRGRFSFGR
jgi:hypothetical protein